MGHVPKIGLKVGRLTVVSEPYVVAERKQSRWYVDLQCTCGRLVKRRVTHVRDSIEKNRACSCGCWQTDPSRKIRRRIRNIYHCMLHRCTNPKNDHWKHYGGRGISVCDEWKKSFEAFHTWATKNGYESTLSIERIDVNGNYCPENCTWIPMRDQAKNTRQVRRLTFGGRTAILKEWSDRLGVHEGSIRSRLRRGLSTEEALDTSGLVLIGTQPTSGKRPRSHKRIHGHGKWRTLTEWANHLGYARQHISYLLDKYGSIEAIPPRKTKPFKQNQVIRGYGIEDSIRGWAERLGYAYCTLSQKLSAGKRIEEIKIRSGWVPPKSITPEDN